MAKSSSDAPGRIWFVTGASSGFGRAIAEAVLNHGGCVVATGREPEALKALVDGM